jgi:hypothetical protein
VLGTLSPSGEPQAALVGYAVRPDFELIFDTLRTTRKYRNMMTAPLVSFTAGNIAGYGDERTVQYEGVAEELAGEPLERLRLRKMAGWRGKSAMATHHLVRRPSTMDPLFRLQHPMTQEWTF